MSDENEKDHEYFTNLLENYKNRLVIAEKEIHLLNNFKAELIDLDRVDNERISELEASSASHTEKLETEIDEVKMMTKHTHPVFKNEIAELRKHITNVDTHAGEGRLSLLNELNELKDWFLKYHDYELEKVQDGLNELKGDLNIERMTNKERYNSQKLLKEVLREFFKKMLHYSEIADFPNDQAHTNLNYFYKQQLEKLDSGGEKEYKGHLMQKTDIIADSDVGAIDSKPPESIIWGDYNAPAGGKITVNNILVKREDLDRLIISCKNVWLVKRIKEEYNL